MLTGHCECFGYTEGESHLLIEELKVPATSPTYQQCHMSFCVSFVKQCLLLRDTDYEFSVFAVDVIVEGDVMSVVHRRHDGTMHLFAL